MSTFIPELEISSDSHNRIAYLEHGYPSDLCRWHFHKSYELHLILESKGNAFVGDYIGNFMENSLFLIGPYVPHNWVSYETKPIITRDRLIQFNNGYFDTDNYYELRALGGLFDLAKYGVEFYNFDVDYCQQQFLKIKHTKGIQRLSTTLELLFELNALEGKKKLSLTSFDRQIETNNYSNIAHVICYINDHYNQNLSLNFIAEKFGYSASAFSRHFHKSTGNCFSSFVNQVRVSRACSLLHKTDDLVSSIGYKVGYNNLANFNRQFIALKNMTPTKYRNMVRKSLQEVV